MLSDTEIRELKETVNRVVDTLDEINDVVRGDEGRNMTGLVRDMVRVQVFIEKWERREYMVRGAFLLLSSNIVLTILGIAAAFLGG